MTDYTDLAQRIVGHGVGELVTRVGVKWYRLTNRTMSLSLQAEQFVKDGRVVLAMMDKVHDLPEPFKWLNVMRDIRRIPLGDPLERAINTACCDSLDEK